MWIKAISIKNKDSTSNSLSNKSILKITKLPNHSNSLSRIFSESKIKWNLSSLYEISYLILIAYIINAIKYSSIYIYYLSYSSYFFIFIVLFTLSYISARRRVYSNLIYFIFFFYILHFYIYFIYLISFFILLNVCILINYILHIHIKFFLFYLYYYYLCSVFLYFSLLFEEPQNTI